MEFFTSCLWKFCLVYGILAFSDGNSRFESGSPDCSASGYNALYPLTYTYLDCLLDVKMRGHKMAEI